MKGFGSHLAASKIKVFRGKNKHELQNFILGMSNHQLNLIDHVVESHHTKTHDDVHFPRIPLPQKHHAVLRQLRGHTHTHLALAKRVRHMKGGGFVGSTVNAIGKGAKAAGKFIGKAGKYIGKAVIKGSKEAGKWMLKHPTETIALGNVMAQGIGAISQMAKGEMPSEIKVEKHHTSAISKLLEDSSDEEDEKAPPKADKKKAKGGASLTRGVVQTHRWVI